MKAPREQRVGAAILLLLSQICKANRGRAENGRDLPLRLVPLEIQNFPLPERWSNLSLKLGCSFYLSSATRKKPSSKVLGQTPSFVKFRLSHILGCFCMYCLRSPSANPCAYGHDLCSREQGH